MMNKFSILLLITFASTIIAEDRQFSYNITSTTEYNFVVLTDLHADVNVMPSELSKLKDILHNEKYGIDFYIIGGDFINIESCYHPMECDTAKHVLNIVNYLDKPFLFTIGNHDGWNNNLVAMRKTLRYHPLYVGICNDNDNACKHNELDIYTLYSGNYGCQGNEYSYGCPDSEDVKWIDDTSRENNMDYIPFLFTHIPPPDVIGKTGFGYLGEHPGCWIDPKNNETKLLPDTNVVNHAFGHDHNNLYMVNSGGDDSRQSTNYIACHKSGYLGYGPNIPGLETVFGSKPGMSYFTVKKINKSVNDNVHNNVDVDYNINYNGVIRIDGKFIDIDVIKSNEIKIENKPCLTTHLILAKSLFITNFMYLIVEYSISVLVSALMMILIISMFTMMFSF